MSSALKEMDWERVQFIDNVMADLGFVHSKEQKSHRKAFPWTQLIIFYDNDSEDWVNVSFPNESQADQGLDITTQAQFNKKITRTGNSLYEFEEEIESWIDECRQKTQGQ